MDFGARSCAKIHRPNAMISPADILAAWIAAAFGRPDVAMKILLSAPTPKKPSMRLVAWHGHLINENGYQEK